MGNRIVEALTYDDVLLVPHSLKSDGYHYRDKDGNGDGHPPNGRRDSQI